jgi:A-factor type gamma-butyrolactone 1'-reductase (1S-forming)
MQDIDRAIDVNHAWRHPRDARGDPGNADSKGGAIVNVSSVGGVIGMPGRPTSSADTKSPAWQGVGLEYATRNIRINSVAPGGTDTECSGQETKVQRAFLASLSPLKRIADPSEIAAAILYLLAT